MGLMDKIHSSLWLKTVSKEENMDLIGELVYSQEGRPHTHLAPK